MPNISVFEIVVTVAVLIAGVVSFKLFKNKKNDDE